MADDYEEQDFEDFDDCEIPTRRRRAYEEGEEALTAAERNPSLCGK